MPASGAAIKRRFAIGETYAHLERLGLLRNAASAAAGEVDQWYLAGAP